MQIEKENLIVIMGVSNNTEKYGYKIFKDLLSAGYRVKGINPKGGQTLGHTVYKTIETEIDDIDLDYIDQILFTSGSTVRAFVNKFGKVPDHIEPLCMGTPTRTIAKEHNINAKIININNP